MPRSHPAIIRRRRTSPVAAPAPAPSPSRVLIVINNRPLQRTAWAAFHTARKRLDKLAGDLRRHEETDTPAYTSWLHGTFPQLITALRELHAEVALKSHQVATVQFEAAMTGRSLKKIWKQFQDELANPPPPQPEPDYREPPPRSERPDDFDEDDDPFADFFEDLFNDGDPRDRNADSPCRRGAPESPPPSADAREIYRRLVQHLHPDRGGEWTPARERLWHEVQQAWAARDADWLARLEINWESANDILSVDSSLDRLRRAIAELQAAHRDTDRKLRAYRSAFAWRFTLSEKKRDQLHARVNTNLRDELQHFQSQLTYLNATIAAWETPPPSKRKPRSR